MSYAAVEIKIIQWAEARKIIPNSTPDVQLLKAMSEMGELADATIKHDKEDQRRYHRARRPDCAHQARARGYDRIKGLRCRSRKFCSNPALTARTPATQRKVAGTRATRCAFVKAILKAHNVYYAMPMGTGYGNSGVPDFLCCIKGKFLAIEAKAGKGTTTALQEKNLQSIRESGGLTAVIYETNIADLEKFVKECMQ